MSGSWRRSGLPNGRPSEDDGSVLGSVGVLFLAGISGTLAQDVDLALAASGVPQSRLRGARDALMKVIEGARDEVDGLTGDARARRLLEVLHKPVGPLGRYDERSTTLREVVRNGRYNCVSATALYLLAARASGVPARAELLPTHARARARSRAGRKRWVVVETTSPRGYAPDAQAEALIARRVLPSALAGKSIVDSAGEQVSLRVLLGAMYVNRASLAQARGQLAEAERLFGEGERLAETKRMKAILRNQRVAVLSRIAVEAIVRGGRSNLQKAQGHLVQAARLRPRDGQIRRLVARNLRAVTERLMASFYRAGAFEAGQNAWVRARTHLPRADQAGLRAFELSQRARHHIENRDFERALSAYDRALRQPLGAGDRELRKTLMTNRAAVARSHIESIAASGDLDAALSGLKALSRKDPAPWTRRAFERAWTRLARLAGQKRLERGDAAGAAQAFRRGLVKSPNDANCRNDLVAALQRLAVPLVERAQCRKLRPLVAEIMEYAPRDRFAVDARLACWVGAAKARLDVGEPAAAVALLDEGRRDLPADRRWKAPLRNALSVWAGTLSKEGRCNAVRSVHARLRALGGTVPPGPTRGCRH